jgi:hypothetical protein
VGYAGLMVMMMMMMMMMISSGITHYPVGLTAPPPKSISA